MLLRNRLNAGDFIVPIPAGLYVKISYNAKGLLESIYAGGDGNDESNLLKLPQDEFMKLKNDKHLAIPRQVNVSGGTTHVFGIIVPDSKLLKSLMLSASVGNLVDVIRMPLLKRIVYEDSYNCTLYAYNMKSNGVKISGRQAITRWISIQRFNLLPGFLAPYEQPETVDRCIKENCEGANGKYAIYCSYITFSKEGASEVYPLDVKVDLVESGPSLTMNENGVGFASVNCTYTGSHQFRLFTAKTFCISRTDKLVLEGDEVIRNISCNTSAFEGIKQKSLFCPGCGRKLIIKGLTRCEDIHCVTRRYKAVCNMLDVLGLQKLDFNDYQKHFWNKKEYQSFAIGDVLDYVIPEGDNPLDVTISTALESVMYTVPDALKLSSSLVNQCNQSLESLMYYANNPSRIASDFDFGKFSSESLIEWFEDVENILEFKSVIEHPKINIVQNTSFYSVPPILRGTKLCITGRFEFGSKANVIKLLSSYSAEIVDFVDDTVKFVVVGDKRIDVDGRLLSDARAAGVCIVEESKFFANFDITKDIKDNLL